MDTHNKEVFMQVQREGVFAPTRVLLSEQEDTCHIRATSVRAAAHGVFAENTGSGCTKVAGHFLPGK